MDLQDLLSNPQVIQQLARAAGVGEGDAQTGLEALLPAVAAGLQRNTQGASGLESLAKALGKGGHQRYLDEPASIGDPRTQADGNNILGHIFGSKQVSRNVAGHAAKSTGLDSTLLKQLLPVVASLAMGALSKQSSGGSAFQPQQQAQSSGGADLLGSLIGGLAGGGRGRASANDSPLDEVLDLAKMFF
ncbi:MAG: DUF937 domain-containing protein [Myxococcota bacterium]